MVQKMHEVKEKARPYLQRCLMIVTRLDKWSHNTKINQAQTPHFLLVIELTSNQIK